MIARFTHSDRQRSVSAHLIELGLCAAFVFFFLWPHPPASLLLLGVAIALAWVRLEIALALLPLTFPYYLHLQPLSASGFPAFSVGELGIMICLGVAVCRNLAFSAERQATIQWAQALWRQARLFLIPALLLLVGASLALLSSPDVHPGLRAYRVNIVEPLLYFLLILRYLRTRSDLVRVITALLLSALIGACISLIQGVFHLTAFLVYVDAVSFRVIGPYDSANHLGFVLDRTIPIVLALGLTHLRQQPGAASEPQRPLWRNPLRLAGVLVLLPLVAALFWSRSRGAEVAVFLIFLAFFVFEVRRWIVILPVLAVGALGTIIFWTRISNLFNKGHAGTVSERFVYWKAALLIIRDHLFGTGPDSFGIQYSPKASNSYALQALNGQPFLSTYDPAITHPHNLFLDFWISTGFLGLAAIVWVVVALARALLRFYRLCVELPQGNLFQRLLLGLAGGMAAGLIHGLVDNSYFLPDLAATFWLFVGLVLVVGNLLRREQPVATLASIRTEEASDQTIQPTVEL